MGRRRRWAAAGRASALETVCPDRGELGGTVLLLGEEGSLSHTRLAPSWRLPQRAGLYRHDRVERARRCGDRATRQLIAEPREYIDPQSCGWNRPQAVISRLWALSLVGVLSWSMSKKSYTVLFEFRTLKMTPSPTLVGTSQLGGPPVDFSTTDLIRPTKNPWAMVVVEFESTGRPGQLSGRILPYTLG